MDDSLAPIIVLVDNDDTKQVIQYNLRNLQDNFNGQLRRVNKLERNFLKEKLVNFWN